MPAQTNATAKTISIDAARHDPSKGARGTGESLDNDTWKLRWKRAATIEQIGDLQDQQVVKSHILIVDADPDSRCEITSILADLHHELIEADSTDSALEAIAEQELDLILIHMNAPEMGGIAFCEAIREAASTQLIPVFIHASEADQEMEARAIMAGADEFLVAPFTPNTFRARVHASLRHKAMLESLDDSESVLFSLAKSVEDRDPDLGQHCQRLAVMAAAMGIAIGLPPAAVRSLQRGGYVHDIGKIGIPDRILFKAGPLTAEEWVIMKSHAERGERTCAYMKSMAPVLPIIRHHHERWDGSGYPDGLKGEQIPLLARILQVVDIYDALTTERPYKRAYSPEEAMLIIREETRKGWRDPVLVEVFADLLPMFRAPALVDTARLSLHALAQKLEQYRRDSLRMPTRAAGNFQPSRML